MHPIQSNSLALALLRRLDTLRIASLKGGHALMALRGALAVDDWDAFVSAVQQTASPSQSRMRRIWAVMEAFPTNQATLALLESCGRVPAFQAAIPLASRERAARRALATHFAAWFSDR